MPDVTIMLDKKRTVKFGINAICSLERQFGCSIGELFPKVDLDDPNLEYDDDGNPKVQMEFNKLIGLLWAGIRHENRRLSPEDVELLVDDAVDAGVTIDTIFAKVMEAFNNSTFLGDGMEVIAAGKKKTAKEKSD